MNKPVVSVVLPVYNGGEHLGEAIASILRQTFGDFELLAIDDGSTDSSLKIIKSFAEKDNRVRVISRPNRGLVPTLNEGVSKARGKYIARQDADDISEPDRLKIQVQYLDSHHKVTLVGSNYYIIDVSGKIINATDVFTHPMDLKLTEVFSNQFGHGTIMARRKTLVSYGFDSEYEHAEDYDLWARIARNHSTANIKKPLYQWRLHNKSVTVKQSVPMKAQVLRIRKREFKYFRDHKANYNFLTFHPTSTNGGVLKYLLKKNTLFRDMALMYCYAGFRRHAILAIFAAMIYTPWVVDTYRQLFITLFAKSKIRSIEFKSI